MSSTSCHFSGANQASISSWSGLGSGEWNVASLQQFMEKSFQIMQAESDRIEAKAKDSLLRHSLPQEFGSAPARWRRRRVAPRSGGSHVQQRYQAPADTPLNCRHRHTSNSCLSRWLDSVFFCTEKEYKDAGRGCSGQSGGRTRSGPESFTKQHVLLGWLEVGADKGDGLWSSGRWRSRWTESRRWMIICLVKVGVYCSGEEGRGGGQR